ncbi:MAG: helix-turn-helix transcriptional regulator [Clostridia bacterium]|nr:helix-turn-helix transcriptional regulator [Clostridia bacterium]
MYRVDIENGYYLFKLKKLINDKNISINQLMRDTNTDFKVLKRLLTGEIVRFDIFVIARLCDYLDCELTDIIEYHPNSKNN